MLRCVQLWVPTQQEVQEAFAAVDAHLHRDALVAFAYTHVFGRAADGGLAVPDPDAKRRARLYRLGRRDWSTPAGSLLKIARRGAKNAQQWTMLLAFAVSGANQALPDAVDEDWARVQERLVALELCGEASPLPFVTAGLDGQLRATLYAKWVDAVLANPQAAGLPQQLRQWVRTWWVAQSTDGMAVVAQERLARTSADPVVQALLQQAKSTLAEADRPGREIRVGVEQQAATRVFGEGPGHAETHWTVRGYPATRPAPDLLVAVVRLITGWALVSAVVRGLAWVLGYRRGGALVWTGAELRFFRRTALFGVTLQEEQEVLPGRRLASLGLRQRAPLVGHLLGVLLFCLLAYLGGMLLWDSASLGNFSALAAGLGLLGAGAALDLALFSASSRLAFRTTLEFRGAGRYWSLRGVPLQQAEAFLAAIEGHPQASSPKDPLAPQTAESAESPPSSSAVSVDSSSDSAGSPLVELGEKPV